jgi:hypothetical protein
MVEVWKVATINIPSREEFWEGLCAYQERERRDPI